MEGFSYTATTRPFSSPGAVSTKEQCVSPNAWPTRRTSVWKISSARSAAETSWKMSNSKSRVRSASRASCTSRRARRSASIRARSSPKCTGLAIASWAPALAHVWRRVKLSFTVWDGNRGARRVSVPAPETRRQRRRMVAGQLAARGITDRRLLATLARLPREWFLPPHLAHDAYEDAPLPIGSGQTISQPYIVALMTQCLAVRRGDRILEIGTGAGYQTAVLAPLGAPGWAIAPRPDLLVGAGGGRP